MRNALLSIGLLITLFPATAAAQCPQTTTASKLAAAEPLGHYAKLVVNRVNAGIAKAKSEGSVGSGLANFVGLDYLIQIESIFYMLVDTDLRSVEYKRNLTTINSCLHYDLAILEAKIEEIRCETLEAYERKSPAAIRLLKSLANFVNERYRHLVKGGLVPEHEDGSWQYYYDFDNTFAGWCCVQDDLTCTIQGAADCIESAGEFSFYPTRDSCLADSVCVFAENGETDPRHTVQCPFDSDYLSSSTNGYGCDLSVLKNIESGLIPGVDAEIEALQELSNKRDDFLEDIDHIKDTTLNMDTLVNQTMLNDSERAALTRFGDTKQKDGEETDHKRVYGCYADLTPEQRDKLEPPPGSEKNSGTEGELTPNIRPSQEWVRIPLRSAFFFHKDHLEIWKAFFQLQTEWAKQREFPDYMKHADEFPEEQDRRIAMEKELDLLRVLRIPIDFIRSLWEEMHLLQATQEASILPKGQDISAQVREAMAPVRPAMKKNAQLVTDSTKGMRKFGINFAYYLRRSCAYRPCNEKLETIIQILFSDECFPYATGSDGGSWKNCASAVQELKES